MHQRKSSGRSSFKNREMSTDEIDRFKQEILQMNMKNDINQIITKFPNVSNLPSDLYANSSIDSKLHKTTTHKQDPTKPLKSHSTTNKTKLIEITEGEICYAKQMSIDKFNSNIKHKTDCEIEKLLQKSIEEYQQRIQVIIDKSDQNYNTVNQQLNSLKEKKLDIDQQIRQMQIEEEKLKQQLYQSEQSIAKLNKRLEIFKLYMPLFEELLYEFEKEDMKEKDIRAIAKNIIEDIKIRRNEEKSCIEDIKEKTYKLQKYEESKKKIHFELKNNAEHLSKQITELEHNNKKELENYQQMLFDTKHELSNYTSFKSENIKLHNMLIQIYNLLFSKLNLERDLIKNEPNLELNSTDYIPRTYDVRELQRYIYLMIRNATEASAGSLLREAIAYSNMMLRDSKNQKLHQGFNPAIVFKEIAALIKSMDKANELQSCEIVKMQEEERKDLKEILNLENKIRKVNMEYEERLAEVNLIYREKSNQKAKTSINFYKDKDRDKDKDKDNKEIEKKIKLLSKSSQKSKSNSLSESGIMSRNMSNDNIKQKKPQELHLHKIRIDTNVSKSRPSTTYNKEYLKMERGGIDFYLKHPTQKLYTHPKKLQFPDSLQLLVEHTNRLFLFKTKNHSNRKRTAKARIERKFKKLEQIQRISTIDKIAGMSNKIISKLDNIVSRFKLEGPKEFK